MAVSKPKPKSKPSGYILPWASDRPRCSAAEAVHQATRLQLSFELALVEVASAHQANALAVLTRMPTFSSPIRNRKAPETSGPMTPVASCSIEPSLPTAPPKPWTLANPEAARHDEHEQEEQADRVERHDCPSK